MPALASAALSTAKGTPKKGCTLAARFMPDKRTTRLPAQLCQLWLSQVSGTGRDQLLMLSGRVDKAVGRAVPVALRPVKQCAWLHQRATALLGSAIGAVRLRWRGSWRIALRLSLGADARHLLVNALLVLRLNVPGPIACSRALRHSQRSRVKGPSTELNVYQSLCKAHAGVPFDNLATINNCKAH